MNNHIPKKFIISSCLLGINCRYDAGHKLNKKLYNIYQKNPELFIVVCPEELGGLPTPRPPCEKFNNKIQTIDGIDKTSEYKKGAAKALNIIEKETSNNLQGTNLEIAFVKSKSPMCGYKKVYDGTFTGALTNGNGVFTEELLKTYPNLKIESID